ncbi:hypothetical protein ABPG72_019090 [Tetrahymena utriculariae]
MSQFKMIIKYLSQIELLKNSCLECIFIDLTQFVSQASSKYDRNFLQKKVNKVQQQNKIQQNSANMLLNLHKLYSHQKCLLAKILKFLKYQYVNYLKEQCSLKILKKLFLILSINIGDEAIFNLSFAFSQCRFLTDLKLNLNPTKVLSLPYKNQNTSLSQCLNLTNLNLQLKANNFQSEGASNLAQQITKCSQIKFLTLFIQSNDISDEGALKIGQAISQLKQLEQIYLNMKYSNVGDIGVSKIVQGLQECKKLAEIEINLLSYRISNKGVSQIAEFISNSQDLKNLKIDLRWNNIDVESEYSIFREISKSKSLKKVSLYLFQKNSDAYNIQQLNLGILKFVTQESLQISKQIENLGVSKITQGLLSFKNLKKLKLIFNQNEIDDQCFQQFSISLQKLFYINDLQLKLKSNKIENLGAKSLFSAFQKLTHLNKLCVDLRRSQRYQFWSFLKPKSNIFKNQLGVFQKLKKNQFLNLYEKKGITVQIMFYVYMKQQRNARI